MGIKNKVAKAVLYSYFALSAVGAITIGKYAHNKVEGSLVKKVAVGVGSGLLVAIVAMGLPGTPYLLKDLADKNETDSAERERDRTHRILYEED